MIQLSSKHWSETIHFKSIQILSISYLMNPSTLAKWSLSSCCQIFACTSITLSVLCIHVRDHEINKGVHSGKKSTFCQLTFVFFPNVYFFGIFFLGLVKKVGKAIWKTFLLGKQVGKSVSLNLFFLNELVFNLIKKCSYTINCINGFWLEI